MKQHVSARPGTAPLRGSDVDVTRLKQLIEIQTQIVEQAKQNELAKRNRRASKRALAEVPRRLLSFLSQLW